MENYEQKNAENISSTSAYTAAGESNKGNLPFQTPPPSMALHSKPTPDNPPWNWAIALLVWLASVILLVTVPFLVIIPYVMSRGINVQDTQGLTNFLLTDPSAALIQIALVIPIHILTLVISWLVATNFRKFSFRETLGWDWGGFKLWHVAPIIVFYMGLAYLLTAIFGEQENELTKILKSSRTAVYFVAFMATFTAPLVEEVVYRGLLYSAFQKRFGVAIGVLATTALFAGVHFPQYWGDFTALIIVTLLSLTLTIIRARTGNLFPCIVLHTVFNGLQSVLLLLEPFLRQQIPTPPPDPAIIIFHLFK